MGKQALIVTIASMKGGVGKTAITSLLARYLAEIEGKQVLVVDFDGRGGITSLLHHEPLTANNPTIIDILLTAFQGMDPKDAFSQAVIQTNLGTKYGWDDKGGSIFLIPNKPTLDDILVEMDSGLLKAALHNLDLPENQIILIDSGADSLNVKMSIAAADIVFLPLILSKQDVHPSVETLRAIVLEQKENGTPLFGGIVINQNGDAQWERTYLANYQKLIDSFTKKVNLKCSGEKILFPLRQSRIIRRGTHLSWSWREDIQNSTREIIETIKNFETNRVGV